MATKKKMLQAAAGQAGGEPGPDVTDVFSTYLYEGNGSTQTITNGISLGDGAADGVYYQSSTSSVTGNLSPLSTITVTNTGGTSLDTSLAKFSTCYQFDGNADFLTLSQPVFDSATPFCFETWVRFNSVGSTSDMGMIANQYTGGQAGRMFFGGQNDQIVVRVNGGTVYLTTGSSSVFTGTWYHVAWTYDGTTHRLYLDGTLKDSDTTMPSIYTGTNTEIGGIDPNRLSGYDLFGRLEDIRVTLGKARYTGSSYTVPTAKFPQDTLAQGRGGLVWIKSRTSAFDHGLFDTERGATKFVRSNTAAAETTAAASLTSFNSDGFDLGSYILHNGSGYDYASWTFAKTPKLLDIVEYTGNGVLGREISHDLGCTVGTLMIKNVSGGSNDWVVWHRGIANNRYLMLNNNNAALTDTNVFNDTAPTSTNFTVGTRDTTNANGLPYVAYLFAHNDGDGGFGPNGNQDIIKCGSYTGNGADQEIDIGFEPQWILVKPSTFTHDWYIWDTMRGFKTYSGTDTNNLNLKPNEADAESDFDGIALTSTGFSLHGASNAANNSGQTYIYMAIRRGPLAQPESATEVFTPFQGQSSGGFVAGFPVDMFIAGYQPGGESAYPLIAPRLTAGNFLTTSSTAAESSGNAAGNWDNMTFVGNTGNESSKIAWLWKRAPGFCDVVAYTGDGVAGRTVSHNLGVAPEMMWVKSRTEVKNWIVYHKDLTDNTKYLELNDTDAEKTATTAWNSTSPTETVFTVGTATSVNNSNQDFIAYLFATLPGVSKVGSYTGSNSVAVEVDCGFTSGARFVLIKRTDAVGTSGNWYVYDSVRGIVSAADDPYLLINTTDAEASNTNNIEPLSSGFKLTIQGNNPISVNGGSYIFYAIA